MEPQKTPNSQSSLEKEEQSWRYHVPWFAEHQTQLKVGVPYWKWVKLSKILHTEC